MLPYRWSADRDFKLIFDWVWHARRQFAACAASNESNLYLVTFSAFFALHVFFGVQQPEPTNKLVTLLNL